MHQILAEKEQCLLRDLREEEERILEPMEKNLRKIQEKLNSIEEELSNLQKQIEEEDNARFVRPVDILLKSVTINLTVFYFFQEAVCQER
eukprot:g23928.t1